MLKRAEAERIINLSVGKGKQARMHAESRILHVLQSLKHTLWRNISASHNQKLVMHPQNLCNVREIIERPGEKLNNHWHVMYS